MKTCHHILLFRTIRRSRRLSLYNYIVLYYQADDEIFQDVFTTDAISDHVCFSRKGEVDLYKRM